MFSRVQDDIRPNLIPVEKRGQVLKTLGSTSAQLRPGSAVAIMGPPGADLRRLAHDIIRGIGDPTVIVWIDLADIAAVVATSKDSGNSEHAGVVWDKTIRAILVHNFKRVLATDVGEPDVSQVSFDTTAASDDEDERLEDLLIHFCGLARKRRYWPVIVLESMHEIPWSVSERLQQALRVALDNRAQTQVLRLVMTGHSDFLSGEYLVEGDAFLTSPLFQRTGRYIVAPFTTEDLCELTPLPGGLPDELLDVLVRVTGGYAGFLELFMEAIQDDTSLGRALYDTFSGDGSERPPWLWEWLARAEGLGEAGRTLIRRGLSVMLSNAKGRSKQVVDALVRLMEGRPVKETTSETLLPLELAGIARLDQKDGLFVYSLATPLVKPLMAAALPRGKKLRERIIIFARNQAVANRKLSHTGHVATQAKTEIKTTGTHTHVWTQIETDSSSTPADHGDQAQTAIPAPGGPPKNPLHVPEPLDALVKDRGPSSARAIIELTKEVTRSVKQARSEGNPHWVTLSQLEIGWIPLEDAGNGLAASPLGNATITAELPSGELRGRWEVVLKKTTPDPAAQVAAGALFVAPDRLSEFLAHVHGESPLKPTESDDVYAIGILAGLLLTRKNVPQLMLQALENRLTGALQISVGKLVRLLTRCLSANADERPSLNELRKGLHGVLHDPLARWRRLLRYLLALSLSALVGTALYDFFLDTEVDNPSRFYTMIKVMGAAGGAAFYVLAWLLFGRTDKAQIHRELWNFLRQRLNRFRWLLIPTVLALAMSGVFAYRIWHSREIKVALPRGALLEEVRVRHAGSGQCESVYRFEEPATSASLRLPLDPDRAYSFIVLKGDEEEKGYLRFEYYWPPEMVAAQRQKPWGDTLDIYSLQQAPPDGMGCLPMVDQRVEPHLPYGPMGHPGPVPHGHVERDGGGDTVNGAHTQAGIGRQPEDTTVPALTPRPLPRGVPASLEANPLPTAPPSATPSREP